MKKLTYAVIFILFIFSSAFAAGKPEIFVETGHGGSVLDVVVSPDGKYLLSTDKLNISGTVVIWNAETGKQIRTITVKTNYGQFYNIYFNNNNEIVIMFSNSMEVYDVYGQLKSSSKINIQYFFGGELNSAGSLMFTKSNKIYSTAGWSEVILPEVSQHKEYEVLNIQHLSLGCGYTGTFIRTLNMGTNVEYTIYDENLKVAKKGTMDMPEAGIGDIFMLSEDMKTLGIFKMYGNKKIYAIDLTTGQRILEYSPKPVVEYDIFSEKKETLSAGMFKDGKIYLTYIYKENISKAKAEIILLNTLPGGIVTQKSVVVDNIDGMISITNSPLDVSREKVFYAGYTDGSVASISPETGEKIIKFGVSPSLYSTVTAIDGELLNFSETWRSSTGKISIVFNQWDLKNARLVSQAVKTETGLVEKPIHIGADVMKTWFSDNPDELYSKIPLQFFEMDRNNPEEYGRVSGAIMSMHSGGNLFGVNNKNRITLKDRSTQKEVADLYAFANGEWIIITPDGYYNASSNGDKYISVRIDNNIYSIENYREAFFRPDLVRIALAGGILEGYKTLADIGKPPVVKIAQAPSSTDRNVVDVTLRITDTGGGIGDVRLYLNDSSVMTESSRALKAKDNSLDMEKTYTVKLLNGANVIRAVAFDGANNVQSNPAETVITSTYKTPVKPNLYAVILGINDYKNPKLTLKYAKADADMFADALTATSAGLFNKISVKRLTTRETTDKTNIIKELTALKNINPDDVFVFYAAAHGTVDDGEYMMITSNVGALSSDRLKQDSMTQKELKDALANIPAAKKLIVMDTCNSGKFSEAVQSAMLTRGMDEDTAIKILSRAVGSTVISASSSLQEALEGYKGHGLFTYVLVQGLKGAADRGKSGFVRTSDLANYVEETVPDIAESEFKRAQYPTKAVSGNDFPIGRVKK